MLDVQLPDPVAGLCWRRCCASSPGIRRPDVPFSARHQPRFSGRFFGPGFSIACFSERALRGFTVNGRNGPPITAPFRGELVFSSTVFRAVAFISPTVWKCSQSCRAVSFPPAGQAIPHRHRAIARVAPALADRTESLGNAEIVAARRENPGPLIVTCIGFLRGLVRMQGFVNLSTTSGCHVLFRLTPFDDATTKDNLSAVTPIRRRLNREIAAQFCFPNAVDLSPCRPPPVQGFGQPPADSNFFNIFKSQRPGYTNSARVTARS